MLIVTCKTLCTLSASDHPPAGASMMSSAVRRRVVTLIVLVSAWVGGTSCFSLFSTRVAERSKELAHSSDNVNQEVTRSTARLYITSVENRPEGRRFHLLLTGYLAKRPADSGLKFQYDEGTKEVVRITERRELERQVEITGSSVTLLRYEDISYKEHDQIDERLDIDDRGWPRNLLVTPEFMSEHIALNFRYRTNHNVIQQGRLELMPNRLHGSPVLAQVNKLNYLWSVPADAAIITSVVGIGAGVLAVASPVLLIYAVVD
jgi:hypothetical protein